MKRTVLTILFWAWSISSFLSPQRAWAQYPNGYELLCPSAEPLPAQGGTSFDPSTQLLRAFLCTSSVNGFMVWNDVVTNGGAVSSVFGRTGAVVATSGDYTVSQVTGAAPLASPALTGTPTAPTATALTNNTQLATTAYTDSAVTAGDAFSKLTSGTNTTAAMVVGTGASLGTTGTGTVSASNFNSAVKMNATTLTTFSPASGTAMVWQTSSGTEFELADSAVDVVQLNPAQDLVTVSDATGDKLVLAGNPEVGFELIDSSSAGMNSQSGATEIVGTSLALLSTTNTVGVVGGASGAFTYKGTTSGSITVGCFTATCTQFGAPGTGTAVSFAHYIVNNNCASAASPASCAADNSGDSVIATGTTSVVIDTTGVDANSQVFLTPTEATTVGTRLGVTCNTTAATVLAVLAETARTSGTSFTVTTAAATVATNPLCFHWFIIN
jgi:hypothetical protein